MKIVIYDEAVYSIDTIIQLLQAMKKTGVENIRFEVYEPYCEDLEIQIIAE